MCVAQALTNKSWQNAMSKCSDRIFESAILSCTANISANLLQVLEHVCVWDKTLPQPTYEDAQWRALRMPQMTPVNFSIIRTTPRTE